MARSPAGMTGMNPAANEVVVAILLIGLARRWLLVREVLILLSVAVIAVVVLVGVWPWSAADVVAIAINATLLALLLSPSMRDYARGVPAGRGLRSS